MNAVVEKLEAENAYLKEQVAQLTGTDETRLALKLALNIEPKQARVLAVLLAARFNRHVSTLGIYQAVFEKPDGSGPTLDIVKVAICHIRKRLHEKRAPGRIERAYDIGYRLTPDLRQWLNAQIGGAA